MIEVKRVKDKSIHIMVVKQTDSVRVIELAFLT